MITDITFGQYFPAKSVIHRLDPRIKFLMLIFVIVFIFLATDFYCMSLVLIFSILIMILSRIPFKTYLKNIKAILPIIISSLGDAMAGISIGGTSLLIMVGVALDTVQNLESQMMMRHYKGFLD